MRNGAAFALIVGALLACIACDRSPGPLAPSPGVVSIAVRGSALLSRTGESAQLGLTSTFTDGTTKDVTAAAIWWSDDQGVFAVWKGLVTATRYGRSELKISYGSAALLLPVRVLPEGAFLVTGYVRNAGAGLEGVRVTATSPMGAFDAVTDAKGHYVVPGIAAVTLRAEKYGFEPEVRQVTVGQDSAIDVDLRTVDTRSGIRGAYRLTVTASPSCTLPGAAMPRAYSAFVEEGRNTQRSEDLIVTLSGPNLIAYFGNSGFTGAFEGNLVRFDITDNFLAEFSFVDGDLSYSGTARGMVASDAIVTTFSGTLRMASSECRATDHRLELRR